MKEVLRDASPPRIEAGQEDIELASVSGRAQHHEEHFDLLSSFSDFPKYSSPKRRSLSPCKRPCRSVPPSG
ncbi:hypothetical protein FVEG_13334 [Fusarium verticillioides 7600]|uniref:Uncharacterized protein n=1 Tax=Gibberella moniliformis (strain M3125 / FGSC 7600) TaxID=334819 RepID=W7MUX1_GIBM7|nr:hypothetical protein FVEG_13334 [Fusarium verticillioides 7600]EWG55318.1 hypothetical protein FVEG_13334 [Fusarium verticillioides 7600]